MTREQTLPNNSSTADGTAGALDRQIRALQIRLYQTIALCLAGMIALALIEWAA